MYQNIATKVLTGEVRLSYANLITPKAAQQGDTPKYSVQLLIPKTDTATYNDIVRSIEAAAVKAINEKWGGVRPNMNFRAILHDGDGVKPDAGTPYSPECKGCWVLNASSLQKPGVVDISNKNVELAPQDIYSGMYARVTVNFYGYKNRKTGVACGLGNVMKTRDGEPLSGGASASADFADVDCPAVPNTTSYATPNAAPNAAPYAAPNPAQTVGHGTDQYAQQHRINPLTGLPE